MLHVVYNLCLNNATHLSPISLASLQPNTKVYMQSYYQAKINAQQNGSLGCQHLQNTLVIVAGY